MIDIDCSYPAMAKMFFAMLRQSLRVLILLECQRANVRHPLMATTSAEVHSWHSADNTEGCKPMLEILGYSCLDSIHVMKKKDRDFRATTESWDVEALRHWRLLTSWNRGAILKATTPCPQVF